MMDKIGIIKDYLPTFSTHIMPPEDERFTDERPTDERPTDEHGFCINDSDWETTETESEWSDVSGRTEDEEEAEYGDSECGECGDSGDSECGECGEDGERTGTVEKFIMPVCDKDPKEKLPDYSGDVHKAIFESIRCNEWNTYSGIPAHELWCFFAVFDFCTKTLADQSFDVEKSFLQQSKWYKDKIEKEIAEIKQSSSDISKELRLNFPKCYMQINLEHFGDLSLMPEGLHIQPAGDEYEEDSIFGMMKNIHIELVENTIELFTENIDEKIDKYTKNIEISKKLGYSLQLNTDYISNPWNPSLPIHAFVKSYILSCYDMMHSLKKVMYVNRSFQYAIKNGLFFPLRLNESSRTCNITCTCHMKSSSLIVNYIIAGVLENKSKEFEREYKLKNE